MSDPSFFGGLADQLRSAHAADWRRTARPNQLAPVGDWRIWLLLAGRGFGKTRTIMEFVREEVQAGRAARVAFVASTASDARDVLVSGHSGILAISPPWFRPIYEPTKRLLTWPNGAIATTYSADEPDRLRGPQFDLAVCDELAAWRHPEALDMLLLGLRIGANPRLAIATTPRPTRVIRDLLKREGKDVAVTRGSTLDNRQHLAPAYIEQIIARYAGTRLERQEVHGEVLEDAPGALWQRENIERHRVEERPQLVRIVVAIDPAGSSEEGADETGIVVAALGQDGHGYVLDDLSGRYDPPGWARAAIGAFHVWKADRIVVERNFGGDMVTATLASIDPNIPVKEVSSSRGKVLRAEPIAAYFEQGRAHFVGTHPTLEDQCCRFTSDWSREKDGSPDRVDALVFTLTELLLTEARPEGFIKQASLLAPSPIAAKSREPVDPPTVCRTVFASIAACIADPDALAMVFFANTYDGPLIVLDWELIQLEAGTLATLPQLLRPKLTQFAEAHRAGHALPPILEAGGIGDSVHAVLKAANLLPLVFVDDLAWGTLPNRIVRASGRVASDLVRVSRPAFEKLQSFKSVHRNHLLAQVTAFGLAQDAPATGELLVAFANGVCAKYEKPARR